MHSLAASRGPGGRGVEPWFAVDDEAPGTDACAATADRATWVTRRFFVLCEHPRTRARTLDAVRRNAGDAVAGRLLVGVVGSVLNASLGRSRRLDDTAVVVELVAAQLAGVAVLRYVTRAEPLASMPLDQLVARLAPAVRATLQPDA